MLYDKVYINPIHSNFPKTKEEPVAHVVTKENTQSYKVIVDPHTNSQSASKDSRMYMYIILTRRPLIKLILLLYLFLDAVIFSAILKKAAKCSFIP